EAGTIYAMASFSAIWARIAWGALGERFVPTRWIMSGIGLFGAVAAFAVSSFDSSWSVTQITLIAVLYNITALSWHGILLAETARLSPPDKVGGVTGGVLAFTSIAMMIYPAVFGLLLAQTGSYRTGYLLGAFPSLLAFLVFIKAPVPGPWLGLLRTLPARVLTRTVLLRAGLVVGLGTAAGIALSR
ncbi:MAG: MFS transporter, partial [Gammaproteobacteria bacterium]|nr:MFS transporter [Gammaproteobacteria bacterium]